MSRYKWRSWVPFPRNIWILRGINYQFLPRKWSDRNKQYSIVLCSSHLTFWVWRLCIGFWLQEEVPFWMLCFTGDRVNVSLDVSVGNGCWGKKLLDQGESDGWRMSEWVCECVCVLVQSLVSKTIEMYEFMTGRRRRRRHSRVEDSSCFYLVYY